MNGHDSTTQEPKHGIVERQVSCGYKMRRTEVGGGGVPADTHINWASISEAASNQNITLVFKDNYMSSNQNIFKDNYGTSKYKI